MSDNLKLFIKSTLIFSIFLIIGLTIGHVLKRENFVVTSILLFLSLEVGTLIKICFKNYL